MLYLLTNSMGQTSLKSLYNCGLCNSLVYILLQTNTVDLLTLNIPSLSRQRCLSSWGPRRTPWFFFVVISQLFDAVDYSNYVFWFPETLIQ